MNRSVWPESFLESREKRCTDLREKTTAPLKMKGGTAIFSKRGVSEPHPGTTTGWVFGNNEIEPNENWTKMGGKRVEEKGFFSSVFGVL